MAKLRITQVKSRIGHPEEQRRALIALGLRRMHASVVQEDSATLRGMVKKVRHLVKVEVES